MAGAFAAVHDLDVAGRKGGAPGQREQAVAQGALGQRGEFIEERQNEGGSGQQEGELEEDQTTPGPKPPRWPECLFEFQYGGQQRPAQEQRQERAFEAVAPPQTRRGRVEPKAFFEMELGVPLEGQFRQRQDETGGEQKGRAGPRAGSESMGKSAVKPGENSAKENKPQHDGFAGQF